jgi:hypothetical protein
MALIPLRRRSFVLHPGSVVIVPGWLQSKMCATRASIDILGLCDKINSVILHKEKWANYIKYLSCAQALTLNI